MQLGLFCSSPYTTNQSMYYLSKFTQIIFIDAVINWQTGKWNSSKVVQRLKHHNRNEVVEGNRPEYLHLRSICSIIRRQTTSSSTTRTLNPTGKWSVTTVASDLHVATSPLILTIEDHKNDKKKNPAHTFTDS